MTRQAIDLCQGLVLALCLFALGAGVQPAHAADKRVALLIGNANYSVGALRNPPNDVRVMDESLKALGFQTQVVLNANQNAMRRAVRDFGSRADGADVALLYYSGHGTQALGENYLIPLHASIEKESDYEIEAISAKGVLTQIAGARPKAAIVILDACRDNPLAATTKSAAKGLSRMEAPTGTLIAFATAPGTTASDDGHYARVLAQQLRKPGQELVSAFRATAAEVLRLSQRKQDPRISEVSINEPIYLAGMTPVGTGPGVQVASIKPEPVVPGLNLDDLHRQAAQEAERQRREQAALARMQADFDKVAAFSGTAALQVQAWDRFLGAWGADKVPGAPGQQLRSQAEQRLTAARAEASRPAASSAVSPGVAPSVAIVAGTSQTFTVNGVSFRMQNIPGGSFMMGSPEMEATRYGDEGPQRRVSLKAYQLGQTEVTQGLWRAVMGGNPSRFSDCGESCPVERVNWDDAQAFIQKLNELTGERFRLPSEAEWEYAARAGCETPFNVGGSCRGKIEASEANFNGNHTYNGSSKGEDRAKTTKVGSFQANSWGLHDMHGNVWEWVQDCYRDSYKGAPTDGRAVEASICSGRVLRGGSWINNPQWLRSAIRVRNSPVDRYFFTGFRLARTF